MASSSGITEQEVKSYIKSIITANPLVSNISYIQKEYKEMIGTQIPYHKFGYNSTEHFLKSIPDTCVVSGTGPFATVTLVVSEKSAHIYQMVSQQKVNVKGRRKNMYPQRRAPKAVGSYMTNNVRRPPSWQKPTNSYAFSPNASSSSSSMSYTSQPKQSFPVKNTPATANISNQNIQPVRQNINVTRKGGGFQNETTEETWNFGLEQNKLESKRVKERLDNLIKQQMDSGNVTKAQTTSQSNLAVTDTARNYDNSNPPNNAPSWDRNKLHPSTINKDGDNHISENNNGLFERTQEKLNSLLYNYSSVNEKEEEEDNSNVPKRVQSNLRTLISQFGNGIWCSDLPEHYKKLFKKDLMYMEYGYTSLIEMCVALKHIFHYVRPGRDDFKLYDKSKPLPENVEKSYTIASFDIGKKVMEQALPELEFTDFLSVIPNDVFKYGQEISREFLPSGTKEESVFDVVVMEIYDPSKFWFYLGTSDNSPVDELMDSLQTFYNDPENAQEYAIPPGAIAEGLYCAQVIYGEWHRARIVALYPDSPEHVRVFYIDYGTVNKAPVKGMCFLHNNFAKLKAQAIRGRLANISPTVKGQQWPRAASDRFRSLVNRRDTKIKISYVDWHEEYVCVFLADITDKNNVLYINEVLVNENHAVWDGQAEADPMNHLYNFKCLVENIHLFPTFVELEYALAPNSSEMYTLEDMLVPYHLCLHQYFEPIEEYFLSCDESELDQIETCFVDTVKNHRRFMPLTNVDVNTVVNAPPIDYDIFGELKQETIEFCRSIEFEEQAKEEPEERLYCDVEEQQVGEKGEGGLGHFEEVERTPKDYKIVKSIQEDKEISYSILDKLEKYSLLDSISSGNTESEIFSPNSENSVFGMPVQSWSPEETIENDLSTILERSEYDPLSPPSATPRFFGFGLTQSDTRSDRNIFDNPEEFESTPGTTPEETEVRPVTPESFLKTVERIYLQDLEEEGVEVTEEVTSPAENSSEVVRIPENPFKFHINEELREAFRTFLKTKDTNNTSNPSSNSTLCPDASNPSEKILLVDSDDEDGLSEESFLTIGGKSRNLNKAGSLVETEPKIVKSEVDLPFKSALEDTRKGFISSLSLNNPFRSYLEVNSEKNVEEVPNIDSKTTESITKPPESVSTTSKTKDEALAPSKMSDSEGSEYSAFVPKGSGSQTQTRDNVGAWVQSTMRSMPLGMATPPRMGTPPRIGTPPRMFPPTGFMPHSGYPPYPQWSNGGGYPPVPQYGQWSNGGNYPMPYPNYPPARDNLRPPPGFSYRCPPQMGPRVIPAVPVYPPYHGGPYYPQDIRHPTLPEMDFYSRFNTNRQNHK